MLWAITQPVLVTGIFSYRYCKHLNKQIDILTIFMAFRIWYLINSQLFIGNNYVIQSLPDFVREDREMSLPEKKNLKMNCICEGWINPWGPKEWSPQPSRGQTGAEGKKSSVIRAGSQSAFPRGALWKKIRSSNQLRIFYVLLKQRNIFKGERERRVWFFMWQLWLPAQHGGRQMSHQASPEKSELQVS